MESRLANFDIMTKLGAGAYSSVYKVQRKSDGQIYALKKVKLMDIGDREKQNALNEVRIIASIHQQNIVCYKECFIEDNNLCIIMEFADQGDLLQKIQKHVKKQQYIAEKEIWSIAIQSLNGLRTLHKRKILHRDLKCANIFLYEGEIVKLGDFNVSKLAKNGLVYTQTGTPYYASPEVWQDKPYDHKADIWSLGCVLYETCSLKPPFRAKDMDGLYRSVLKGHYAPIPAIYSAELAILIKSMMQLIPANRPDCDKLLMNPAMIKRMKQFDIEVYPEEGDEDLLKTIRWPAARKGLATNKSEMITLNFQLPGSNYLNQHNSNHIRRNQQSTRIKSQDNNESIVSHNEALNNILKNINLEPIQQLQQKKPLEVQIDSVKPERRLRVSNSTHEKHEKYDSNQHKCSSKDRQELNYYAKDVIQSLSKQQYSQKLPQIVGQQDEYLLRKNSSNEKNQIRRNDQSSLSIKQQPSAERNQVLRKIIEESQLPKLQVKRR